MSLYVGRLPPHIRPEELLRVFRNFGRCELQLKDGYGFVVYKVITDAEKALRALRGKNICGEQLSLNWSNRQPRPHQRSPNPCRVYEPYRGRNFKGENGVGIRVLPDQRELSRSDPHVPSYNHGKHQGYVHDKETVHTCEDDDIGQERNLSLREEVTDGGNAGEHNPVENDRWGVPVTDELTGHGVETGSEFDLYEPYHGYDRRDEKENSQMTSSYSSAGRRSSPVKRCREPSYDETTQTNKNRAKLKPQPACYNCGQVGHIKRNCPEGDVRRDIYSKFGHGREEIKFRDRAVGRQKMLRGDAWERLDANRGALIFRHHGHDEKESHSGRSRRLVRRRESSPERREKRRLKLRAESQAKKRSKKEHGTWRNIVKKRRERRSDASSLSSDSSTSQSSKSELHSTSCSTSRSSSRSHSAPSHSRSVSVSSSSKSKSSRLRSRSSSGSKSATFSVSSGKKSSSSPQNVHLNVSLSTSKKGKLEHPLSHFSKNVLCENSEVKDENALVTVKVDNEVCGQHLGHNADNAPYSASMVGYKEDSSTTNLPKAVDTTEQSNLRGALMTKPKSQSSVGCGGRNPLKITTQEMILALKHYGLTAPEEGESEISVEEYFGAARLWPWEMIYYRRLKKGPISTENYARRLEQNKEFGIVDKYIRSSSGWAECEQNDK